MRVAVLSDTHGNVTAFEAVLTDICSRAVDRVVHLGDVIGKGPRGSACCDLARRYCDAVVMGNWEASLLGGVLPALGTASRWWRDEVAPQHQKWLAELPYSADFSLGGVRIRGYHASADGLFHRIYPTVSGDEWDGMFANTPETGNGAEPDLVIYGDIHYAWSRKEGEHTLLNCGSVGNPLDEPTASYIVLDASTGDLHWELVRVPYDIEAELAVAREMNMPQYEAWVHELRNAEYAR